MMMTVMPTYMWQERMWMHFFSRVAALAFEKAVIREAEDDTTDTGAVADSDQIITISKRDSHINGTSGSEGTKCCK